MERAAKIAKGRGGGPLGFAHAVPGLTPTGRASSSRSVERVQYWRRGLCFNGLLGWRHTFCRV